MPDFLISGGLPGHPSGLADKEAALVSPLYKAVNTLAQQLSVNTGNVQYLPSEQAQIDQFTKLLATRTQKIFIKAGENLNYGHLVTLSISAGRIVAHKADNTILTKPAHAVVDAPGGILSGEYGEAVFIQGRTAGISGSTFAGYYWLSTAGQAQSTKPVGPGIIIQYVGMGFGTAGFYLDIREPE